MRIIMPTTTTTAASSTDRIEKLVDLDAPRSRVWRALTDPKQFSQWFGVSLSSPFTPGAAVSGKLTFKSYDHLTLTIWIETLDPERLFSFRWHPYAVEEGVDYSAEPTTLVTFTLEDAGAGTRLKIVESGFDAIPESRRAKAFSMNSAGWDGQVRNIQKFLSNATPDSGPRNAPHEQAAESLYGVRQLVDGMRAVRANTILMAGDIPESQYGFRPTPVSRSIAETLVHIAWLATSDRILHEEERINTVEGFDFPALLKKSEVEEKRERSKAEIMELLRTEGDRQTRWLEQQPENFFLERVQFPGGGSVSRFEMLLATKEHELQHRAQLTVIDRLIGIAPRFTGLS
jgi:uncharacterized protein YndB with AHSA1/START domain/uncharacterized damage-inducible protein DinB